MVANTAVFLTMVFLFEEKTYLYDLPLFFSLQLVIHFFLFAAKLPFFIPTRLSLVAGIIPGILPFAVLANPWLIFLLSAVLSVFPNRWLHEQKLTLPMSQVRLKVLRQWLDLLRFLFLGFSLFGIFDVFRSYFYPVVGTIVAGSLLQYAMLKLDRRRHHIKQGVILLAVGFTALGVGYIYTPFPIWAAMGYGMLAIWEALYFKKVVEGYLNREQAIIALSLLICLASYFVTYQWSVLIFGILGILIQVRIIGYVFNRYRLVMGGIFLISLATWGVGVYEKYKDSFTRQFFNITATHEQKSMEPDLLWLSQLPAGKDLYTNAFNAKTIESAPGQSYFRSINYYSVPVFLKTLVLKRLIDKNDNQAIYLFNINLAGPYRSKEGFKYIENLLGQSKNIFFYRTIEGQTEIIAPAQVQIIEQDEKGRRPQLSDKQKDFCLKFGTHLARQYAAQARFFKALEIYKELVEIFDRDEQLFAQAARLAGSVNQADLQIEFLKRYIRLTDKDAIDEKKVLMELYFAQGDLGSSKRWAERLIDDDPDNTYTYLKWILRLYQNKKKYVNWREFYYDVKAWRVKKDAPLYQKKIELLARIKQIMKQNPQWYVIQRETNDRQEHIVFPE